MKYSIAIKENNWIILIVIVAAILRIYHIGFQGAWLDEVHTLKESDPMMTLSEFHKVIMFREGIPHFYFLIIRFLSEIFGSNIITARSVSAVAGIASVYFIFLLGKELWNKHTGHVAAIFMTFNLFHIEYSQEARSYALMACFTILAFYYMVKLTRGWNLKNAILSGLFTGLITNAQPIGLVNVIAIYFFLFMVLIASNVKERKVAFKYSLISGIVALIVFSPVYQIVMKVKEIKGMWIPAPTFDSIQAVFISLSGQSKIVLYVTILFAVTMVIMIFVRKGEVIRLLNNRLLFAVMILFFWIAIEAGIIIIKSYTGESIVLNRYFIGLLPALVLVLAIGIDLIGNQIVKIIIVSALTGLMIFKLISPNYYTTRTKSQYDLLCAEVTNKNTHKDKIVSNWAWLLSYYLNRDNKGKPVIESSLENYVDDLKNDAIDRGSFWYVDGNSRPYGLSAELSKYLQEHYIITDKIELYDSWAYHFKAKMESDSNLSLDLTNFEPSNFDGSGRLIFFEMSTVKYPPIALDTGKYKLIIKGLSQPEIPINNENAHINVIINGTKTSSFYLSEKKDNSDHVITFEIIEPRDVSLQLNFDNDLLVGKADRNAVISQIKIVKEK